jgi:hypothetical protein
MIHKNFIRGLLSGDDERSSRKLITLVISFHFILSSFVLLFTKVSNANAQLFEKIIDYDFFIIVIGMGFITVTDFIKLMLARFNKSIKSEED